MSKIKVVELSTGRRLVIDGTYIMVLDTAGRIVGSGTLGKKIAIREGLRLDGVSV